LVDQRGRYRDPAATAGDHQGDEQTKAAEKAHYRCAHPPEAVATNDAARHPVDGPSITDDVLLHLVDDLGDGTPDVRYIAVRGALFGPSPGNGRRVLAVLGNHDPPE
jgi:hypothetical protein